MKVEAKASDLYVKSNEARLVSMTTQKPRPALEARDAIPPIKDEKTGEILKKGQPAIQASPEREGCVFMKISANSEKIMQEIANRMAIEGVFPREGAKIEPHHSGVTLVFKGDNQAVIRLAFKKSKGSGEHNKKGLEIFKADKKAKEKERQDKLKAIQKEKEEKEKVDKAAKDISEKAAPKEPKKAKKITK